MAPSAVETVTIQAPAQPSNYTVSVGQYKEVSARSGYDKDAELKGLGKKGFEAAKVWMDTESWVAAESLARAGTRLFFFFFLIKR